MFATTWSMKCSNFTCDFCIFLNSAICNHYELCNTLQLMWLITPRPAGVMLMDVFSVHPSPPYSNPKLVFSHTSLPSALCCWILMKFSLHLIHRHSPLAIARPQVKQITDNTRTDWNSTTKGMMWEAEIQITCLLYCLYYHHTPSLFWQIC